MTEQERQTLLRNPELFLVRYFGERIRKLEDFHLRLIETATTREKGLILYPAGHGKTTLVSTLLPIWAMCRDPNVQLAVIGKNDNEAKNKIGRVVQAELMANDELIRDFGPFEPSDPNKSWSLTNMTIEKRTSRAKEPTIAFFGAGSKDTLGHRANWIICDDVISEKNSSTIDQRETVGEWFEMSVDTMGLPGARLTVVGTLFDPEDLYNDLILLEDPESGDPIWYVQREDAIVDEENRVPLWPDYWPWPKLMAKKASMGVLNFNKRYRNIAVDKSRQVFKEEFVKGGVYNKIRYPGCLDRQHAVGHFDESWLRFSGFDPAIGTTRHAKFCAHVTIAVGSCQEHDRCYWIVDLEREQMSLIQQVETILGRHEKYDCHASIVEANGYQAGLLEECKRRMNEQGLAFRIDPHFTTRTTKPDPELGVQAMAPFFENALFHIPWGNPESMRKMRQLVDELIEFPGRTTDTVMALWFAWREAEKGATRFRSFNRLVEPKPRYWAQKASRWSVPNPAYAD